MADVTHIYGNEIVDAAARQDIADLEATTNDLKEDFYDSLVTDTASGSIASFSDGANDVPVKSLAVAIEPVQSGSGDPSPTNIRPISGHTQAVVTVSPTTDAQDGTSYTIDLDGTIYGGALDVTTGVLTVDRAIVDLGTLNWSYDSTGYFYASVPTIKNATGWRDTPNVICDIYQTTYPDNIANATIDKAVSAWRTGNRVVIRDSSYTNASAFQTGVSGHALVYEVTEPQTIQLTAQEVVRTLLGQNNVFADCGDVSVEYRADTKLYIQKVLNA